MRCLRPNLAHLPRRVQGNRTPFVHAFVYALVGMSSRSDVCGWEQVGTGFSLEDLARLSAQLSSAVVATRPPTYELSGGVRFRRADQSTLGPELMASWGRVGVAGGAWGVV